MNLRVIGRRRQAPLRKIHALPNIPHRRVRIKPRIKLKQHIRTTLVTGGAHFLDPLDGLQLLLNGPNQKALSIFGRDAVVADRHINNRYVDVRLGLFGNIVVGDRAGNENKHQRQQHCARITKRCANKRHALTSLRRNAHSNDLLSVADKFMTKRDDIGCVGQTCQPHSFRGVRHKVHRYEMDHVCVIH